MKINNLNAAAIIILIVLSGALIFSKITKKGYNIDAGQVAEYISKTDNYLSPFETDNYLKHNPVIIDIHTTEKYNQRHIKNAINIPFDNNFSENFTNLISQDQKFLLYSDNPENTLKAYLLLAHKGYLNGKILSCSYSNIYQKAKETHNPNLLHYNSEKIKHNYPLFLKQNTQPQVEENVEMKTDKTIKVSGGC